ncbi:hypothetical protein [Paenibacillus paeoniae]|uniref:Uncharacterized protein n=1 Tax=Paenibacillus paeoniae TaxID=2292705 RepID=A0A371PFY1_9BACL|nr:hypothetical protein [Paenibacillus paeoniae]REK74812.1 hypothetical protein DX130_14215 [Paenibacillus paeoniae]
MVNRNRNRFSIALSTALVVSILVTGSILNVQSKTTVSATDQSATNQTTIVLEKSAGAKKVEVIKG